MNSEELRLTYPDLVHHNNINEDNWYCDICLDTGGIVDENGEDEQLVICELCMVVVHPSCYMRDLYDLDPDDESPWYCEKCAYLTEEHTKILNRNNSNDSDHFATGVALRS